MTLCTITGVLRWPDGRAAAGELVEVLALGIRASGDGAMLPVVARSESDHAGGLVLALMPGSYRLAWRGLRAAIRVPDAPGANLQDIFGG